MGLVENRYEEVRFKDVFGLEEELEELKTIFKILTQPEEYIKYGAVLPKGILLSGPPGTGKTLIARALSNEFNVPFYPVMAGDIKCIQKEKHLNYLNDVFELALKNAPAVVFIDEIDSFLGCTSYRNMDHVMANQLLTLMDGFYQNRRVLVLAATNSIQNLPSSLLRPGRFDKTIKLDYPNNSVRQRVVKELTQTLPLEDSVSLDKISSLMNNRSIAEIKQITSDAIISAIVAKRSELTLSDFISASDRHILGIKKLHETRTDEDIYRIAVHEVGHTLMQYILLDGKDFVKVSLAKTVESQGHMTCNGYEFDSMLTETHLHNLIKVLLGGAVAEKIVFGHLSTGVSDDIEKASRLATEMVKRYGMSDLGLRCLDNETYYTSRYSQELAAKADRVISDIIREATEYCTMSITQNREVLDKLVENLIHKKVLMKDEVDALLQEIHPLS